MSYSSSLPVAALLCVAFVALVMALFLSAMETGLAHLSRASVDDLIHDERRHASILKKLVEQRSRTDLTLRGLRTFWQVVLAVSLTVVFAHTQLPWWASACIALIVCSILQFMAVTLIATRIAGRQPDSIALIGARWTYRMLQISHIFDPIIHVMRGYFPQSSRTEAEVRAEMAEDLREMVDQVGETEMLEDKDRQMLRSIFELGHTLVREVMVPRTDMVTIDAQESARKALHLFVRSGFSRIPVIGHDVDDVRGILYFKDLVMRMEAHGGETNLVAEQMMRPAEFTIETKPADDLLRHMQTEHCHLALVVDEYGGISGLVTLEDLIEEVVGELTDEHDRKVREPEQLPDGSWRVSSRYGIWEVGELLGIEVEDEDVDSIGGLLAKAIGKVPLPGAVGDLAGVHMLAEEARGRRRQVDTIVCSLSALNTSTHAPQED
ncbi:hemolysin family protein [Schaalia sp. lx-260]|uniref:hemolysin family protein n=1 Tax=Schaalia sp. lx-260 TaxID=2899082 RepID=UPI002F2B33E4